MGKKLIKKIEDGPKTPLPFKYINIKLVMNKIYIPQNRFHQLKSMYTQSEIYIIMISIHMKFESVKIYPTLSHQRYHYTKHIQFSISFLFHFKIL